MNFALLLTFKLTLLWLYFGKSCKTTHFRKPTEVSQNTSTFISVGLFIKKITTAKKHEKFVLFGGSFFQIKIADILNFQWIKYLGKCLSYWKNWGIGPCCCWNYRSSKLLLHFIKYRLDQLDKQHAKIAVNSAIQYFEGRSQKKCQLKVWSFWFIHHKMAAL